MIEMPTPRTKEQAIAVNAKRYFTGFPCKNGHIAERNLRGACVECEREHQKKWRENPDNKHKIAGYYKKNKEKLVNYASQYQKDNAERTARNLAKRRKENPEYFKARDKAWRDENQEQLEIRKPLNTLLNSMSDTSISWAENELGYTKGELFCHISDRFESGMSWDERSKWHVDHVIPVSLFVANGILDVKMINSLANLQPLWAADNVRKSNKVN